MFKLYKCICIQYIAEDTNKRNSSASVVHRLHGFSGAILSFVCGEVKWDRIFVAVITLMRLEN